MNISLVVFDLDGTLVSSHETIYKTTLHALKEVGINREIPEDKFCKKIGLHFEDIFHDFGFSVPNFEEFITIYKSNYFTYLGSSFVYNGVNNIIKLLNSKNIFTALLTTKGQDQAELLLKHFGLRERFSYVMGRRPGIAHKPSPEPLLLICKDLHVEPHKTIIVGDTEMDIICGKKAGSKTCAVTYGYREKEFLEKQLPDFLIDNIEDLEYIVNGM
ncbi:MAG: phosphoglycolate phosphatase [Ignavibacteria bacterium]|nr:MAG: phosphoglycolate phosphatase [Ignavibacteria bacterium]KAF0160804.1 MAG: phosphoglycolate phosphatase [Ignavibacteria bacterium]